MTRSQTRLVSHPYDDDTFVIAYCLLASKDILHRPPQRGFSLGNGGQDVCRQHLIRRHLVNDMSSSPYPLSEPYEAGYLQVSQVHHV
jgi:hypothetical protein